MALTSQITARPVLGQDPAGFTPLVQNFPLKNIASTNYTLEFNYTALTFGANIPATQANFLTMVKTELDTVIVPTIFTDPAVNYVAEYVINEIKLDFAPFTGDRSIWTQRTWKWLVKVQIKVSLP